MAGHFESLLVGDAPLEPHEASDLRAWLKALEEDCECFGATSEDNMRMRKIRSVLARRDSTGGEV